MESTIKVFKSVRSEAMDLGVKIALENHSGDMQAREVKTIIEEAGKDYVASCLDTGNPMWCVEDPFVTPGDRWRRTWSRRTCATRRSSRRRAARPRSGWRSATAVWTWCKFVAEFRRLCPKSSMQLEIITGRPPRMLPYLEADFWKAFPKTPAAEFARFVALAKSGHPFMGAMVIEDVAGEAARQ